MAPFYVRPQDVCGDQITLREGELDHAVRVCRHKEGDVVEVVDGRGHRFRVRVDALLQDALYGTILDRRAEAPPSGRILLVQALLKGSRFDWVVEKATELGAATVIPLITERTIVPTASANKVARWRKIAVEATKQSLGGFVPDVWTPQRLPDLLSGMRGQAQILVAWESERSVLLGDVLLSAEDPWGEVSLWIGPEGGFTDGEIQLARDAGAGCFSLGSRRLRAETAGIAAVALLQYEWALRDPRRRGGPEHGEAAAARLRFPPHRAQGSSS